MPRPVKWSRDVHSIRERASRSRTETWSRADLEHLFDIKPSAAQNLMKAIGDVQSVGGAHFVDRSSLLSFLDEMAGADSVDEALRRRFLEADAPPAPKPLRVSLAADLRNVMLRDLPDTIRLSPGRLEIAAPSTEAMLESLALLARAMSNDLASVQDALEPPAPSRIEDVELSSFLTGLRFSR